jgi:hypothetical protein
METGRWEFGTESLWRICNVDSGWVRQLLSNQDVP